MYKTKVVSVAIVITPFVTSIPATSNIKIINPIIKLLTSECCTTEYFIMFSKLRAKRSKAPVILCNSDSSP